MTWGARSFPRVAVLQLVFLWTSDWCLKESLQLPKGSQATCPVRCGVPDGSGGNAEKLGFISSEIAVHHGISLSFCDMSVLKDL